MVQACRFCATNSTPFVTNLYLDTKENLLLLAKNTFFVVRVLALHSRGNKFLWWWGGGIANVKKWKQVNYNTVIPC